MTPQFGRQPGPSRSIVHQTTTSLATSQFPVISGAHLLANQPANATRWWGMPSFRAASLAGFLPAALVLWKSAGHVRERQTSILVTSCPDHISKRQATRRELKARLFSYNRRLELRIASPAQYPSRATSSYPNVLQPGSYLPVRHDARRPVRRPLSQAPQLSHSICQLSLYRVAETRKRIVGRENSYCRHLALSFPSHSPPRVIRSTAYLIGSKVSWPSQNKLRSPLSSPHLLSISQP